MNTEMQLFYISMMMGTVGFVAGFLYRGGPSSEDQKVRIGDLGFALKTARDSLRHELARSIALSNVLINLRDSWPTPAQIEEAGVLTKGMDELRKWLTYKNEYVKSALDRKQLDSASDLFIKLNLSAGFNKIRPVIYHSNKTSTPINLDSLHDFMIGAGPDKFTL